MASDYSTFRPFTDGPVLVIDFLDRRLVESHHVTTVESELTSALKAFSVEGVVLDFARVEFLSSAMLSVIVQAQAVASDAGASLVVCGLSKDLRKMFKMMRLDTRIKIFDKREAAKKHFQ